MKTMSPPINIERAEGVYLYPQNGPALIDGISSWWSVIHGYNHPHLNQALLDQMSKVAHVMLCGLTHDPALKLAETLVEISPKGLSHVFFSDSGSVGCEVAIKMALQYWQLQNRSQKTRLIGLKNAYHGDTCAVMSLGDSEGGFHEMFSGFLPSQLVVPADDIDALERCLKAHHEQVAAMIVEPIMQGAGGFQLYSAAYLREAKALCDQYKVLLIFDEVATGFGRTGPMFAADHVGISPDIMVLGKGLTGGYMGLSATLASDTIFDVFETPFMHGPTFMGNPLACAVALASIALLRQPGQLARIQAMESQLESSLSPLRSNPAVKAVRVKGAMGCIEVTDASMLDGAQAYAISQGVWLRPFERYLYTMPAYIMDDECLRKITDCMGNWVSK